MQDYNYVFTNCFEITIEMGCAKFPTFSKLKQFWNDNKYSLLAFMDQANMEIPSKYGYLPFILILLFRFILE